jgi:4-amino-4-deoxy-L-arabinose transferase-like glycosyltransferase
LLGWLVVERFYICWLPYGECGLAAENMTNQLKLHASRFQTFFSKWRVTLLVFGVVYAVLLLIGALHYPLEWDEIVHLNGALNLQSGHYTAFVNNAFYPPLLDCLTAFSFNVFGVSVLSARLVSVLFACLSLWVVFELANSLYGSKVGLLAAVLLGIMPGYFWLSRMALLETMLLFFVTLALFFFWRWLQIKQDRYVLFTGLAVGLGVLTKYQAVVAGLIILVSILFLARGQLKQAFSRFTLMVVTAVLVVVPWVVAAYEVYASKLLDQWLYALQVGNPGKLVYSDRYPAPIFYLIEVVWPYDTFHPVSIFLYAGALAGLVFLMWRHCKADKYTLIWFVSVFVFFSLITNKEWRYVLPLFPTLAIASSVLILFGYGKLNAWRKQAPVSKHTQRKVVVGLFVVLIGGAMAYSVYDAYTVTAYFDITVQLEPATVYAMNRMQGNQTIMVLCPFNFFSQDMVSFYLAKNGDTAIRVSQYPILPVDSYTPQFNITELIALCNQNNVKYLFTYENGGTATYYNTTLNLAQIYEQIYVSGKFSQWTEDAAFGITPRRVIILTFLG